jgi:hypothetical protein
MNWTTFVPTLLATFAGVVLSIVLSTFVYWIRSRHITKREKAITKHVLLLEIINNLGILRSNRTAANEVINGTSNIQTWCDPSHAVHTSALKAAYEQGNLNRLGDKIFEEALWKYMNKLDDYNQEMRWIREITIARFGFLEKVPPAEASLVVQPRLSILDDLIERGFKLLEMFGYDISKVDDIDNESSA